MGSEGAKQLELIIIGQQRLYETGVLNPFQNNQKHSIAHIFYHFSHQLTMAASLNPT
jgi:hypothetical protein